MVGNIVKLKVACLNNKPETLGVCYEDYTIGEHTGSSFIFENGMYDGFSADEQGRFLEFIGFCSDISGYEFKNVMKLSQDFDKGYFAIAFKKAEI